VGLPRGGARLRRLGAQARVELRYAASLRTLPPRVALFMARARLRAHRTGDGFSLLSATRPANLTLLLELARGRRRVVELGTGTGWSALALALEDRRREVVSYDSYARPERSRYAALIGAAADRVSFLDAPGVSGPRGSGPVELLYIDSSHEREPTVEEFHVWRRALAPGAAVIFDDYDHPLYPGVREAVAELGLTGEQRGTLFVWVKPSS
jgi:predicted O-methyltransferase YrrM